MDKDRLKLALRENLFIQLQAEPIEEVDADIYGNVYGVRKSKSYSILEGDRRSINRG